MNRILIIGAGRSATALIRYVLAAAETHNWFVIVADNDLALAEAKVRGYERGQATWLDVTKRNDRRDLITRADLVVSLLPAHLHLEVGYDCIQLNKHLITASYVSQEMYRLGDEARGRDLIFMGEMGLDPGIDHMSAMQKIDEIKAKGGQLTAFRSYTGGLVAPENLTGNPWNYKFTWNPRNVVLAGQGTAQYLENGKFKYIPYNRLFKETRTIEVPGLGEFEAYANRDSLLYREIYGLEDIPNLLRGTIRYPGYCAAWDALVQIGLTSASYPILESDKITYHECMDGFTGPRQSGSSVKERIASLVGQRPHSPVMKKLEWLGLFRKKKINIANATPALILENLLLEKWELQPEDRDLILMRHEFEYTLDGAAKTLRSTLVMYGTDADDTAMARLVGLPIGILTKLVMTGQITATGRQVPVEPKVYNPVLKELEDYGVVFHDEEG